MVSGAACTQPERARVSKKDSVLQILASCAVGWQPLLITEVQTKGPAVSVVSLPIVVSPSPWGWSEIMGVHKASALSLTPLPFFTFSPLGSQILKTTTFKNNCIYRQNKKVAIYTLGKVQKRPQKILSLHFRLIFSTGTAYNIYHNNKKITENRKSWRRGKIWFPELDSNVQHSTKNMAYKETGKQGPFRGKNKSLA